MLIPTVIENGGRSNYAYDIFSMLLKHRIIFVNGEINEAMAAPICAQILYLAYEDKQQPIKMYIQSGGGQCSAGLCITDTMHTCGCPVSTVAMGQVCSMGSFIAAAGTKGMRYSLEGTTWMIHEVSSGASGKMTDLTIAMKESNRINEYLANKLALFTGQSFKKIMKDINRDNFMTATEAVEYGLCDKILESGNSNETN